MKQYSLLIVLSLICLNAYSQNEYKLNAEQIRNLQWFSYDNLKFFSNINSNSIDQHSNFLIETSLQFNEGKPSMGLFLNFKDKNNYLKFIINTDGSFYVLRISDAISTYLAPLSSTNYYYKYSYNNLKIEKNSGTTIFYLNSWKIAEISNKDIRYNYIANYGIYLCGSKSVMTDVNVNFFTLKENLENNKTYYVNNDKNSNSVYSTNYVPKPKMPAVLNVSDIYFKEIDGNNNNILDGNEKAVIKFTISNTGKGNAFNLMVNIEDLNKIKGLDFSKNMSLGNLSAGQKINVEIPIYGNYNLVSGKSNFKFLITETNGFDADPFELAFETQSFKTPEIVIADANFTNNDNEGKLHLGTTASLDLIIQNKGQGRAKNITINFQNPDNVFEVDSLQYTIPSLLPNENKHITYQFFPNKRYSSNEISIKVTVNESYGKYGVSELKTVSLDKTLAKTQQIEIKGKEEELVKITEVSLLSDIDKNIPLDKHVHNNRYALIIGNEDYSSYQPGINNEANVDFAKNDAKTFKVYCENTLGIPSENITLLLNATGGIFKQKIDLLNKLIKNSDGKLEIVFYYAGHGLPDENTHEPFLIPVDVSGNDIHSAIKLSDVYAQLSQYPTARVSIFLDACFSGGARNQGLLAARGIKIAPKSDFLSGNLIVFSASSGEQSSLPYKEKKHGFFTYFLLKKIQETGGDISYKELSDYLNRQVGFESIKINSKEQNPQTNISGDVNNIWGSWRLK